MKVYIRENKIKLLKEYVNNDLDGNEVYEIKYEINEPSKEDYDSEEYESYKEFLENETTYNIECFDYNKNSIYSNYDVDVNTIRNLLGDEIVESILNKEGYYDGNSYWIDELWNTTPDDINDVNSVNKIAKKIFTTIDEYYKDCRGYLLTDGSILDIGYHTDHLSITSVDGMTIGKFEELGNIRISKELFELAKEPTYEQRMVLIKLINCYSDSDLYIDIVKNTGSGYYGQAITSAHYINPYWKNVLAEISQFFSEGINLRGGYNSMYESKILSENLELEVEPNEVDLSSFEKEDELNPKIWNNGEIDSRVRLKLLDIADDFYNTLSINWIEPKDIILTGSICNYNWSKYSDIDLHIVIDFNEVGEDKDLVKEYFDGKKNEWNNKHNNLNMYGLKVELYVQDISEDAVSNGIYSLESNSWIKEPNINDIKPIDNKKDVIKKLASNIMTAIDDLEDRFNSTTDLHKLEVMSDKCDEIKDDIKQMRKESLAKYGEFSIGNICYKVLRRFGYLDKMWDLKVKIYDKINSIS